MTGFGLHPVVARLLAARGIAEPSQVEKFLNPRLADLRSPQGIAGLAEAVRCLARAVTNHQTIGLFGDYDVDGVSATALLSDYLGKLGCRRVTRVARRDAGYGFGLDEARALAQEGVALVVTLDCGTSDRESLAWLRSSGIDVVVVDHHQVPQGESPATALVNPHRTDATFPFRGLCSAGLAFYLCAALRTELGRDTAPDVRPLMDLAALGTIADVVPLLEENRILAAQGIQMMRQRGRPGLRALCERAQLHGSIQSSDVAFRLGPRLNAPGRLGEARPALECLLAEEPAAAADWARVCDEKNQERQRIQQKVEVEARGQAETDPRPFLLLAQEGWHPGVVGIVAQKMVERFGRPAVVLAIEGDVARGSARTANGLDLYQFLDAFRARFVRFGGHAAACGLSVSTSEIARLKDDLAQAMNGHQATSAQTNGIDGDLHPDDLTLDLARDIARLEPFGAGNLQPVFRVLGAQVSDLRIVKEKHLQLWLRVGDRSLRGIAFRMSDNPPPVGGPIDLFGHVVTNDWRGSQTVELQVKRWTT